MGVDAGGGVTTAGDARVQASRQALADELSALECIFDAGDIKLISPADSEHCSADACAAVELTVRANHDFFAMTVVVEVRPGYPEGVGLQLAHVSGRGISGRMLSDVEHQLSKHVRAEADSGLPQLYSVAQKAIDLLQSLQIGGGDHPVIQASEEAARPLPSASPARASTAAAGSSSAQAAAPARSASDAPVAWPAIAPRRTGLVQKNCRFYREGFCALGRKCRYLHDGVPPHKVAHDYEHGRVSVHHAGALAANPAAPRRVLERLARFVSKEPDASSGAGRGGAPASLAAASPGDHGDAEAGAGAAELPLADAESVFCVLPDDLWEPIAMQLDSYSLLSLGSCCRDLYFIVKSLWERHTQVYHPRHTFVDVPTFFRMHRFRLFEQALSDGSRVLLHRNAQVVGCPFQEAVAVVTAVHSEFIVPARDRDRFYCEFLFDSSAGFKHFYPPLVKLYGGKEERSEVHYVMKELAHNRIMLYSALPQLEHAQMSLAVGVLIDRGDSKWTEMWLRCNTGTVLVDSEVVQRNLPVPQTGRYNVGMLYDPVTAHLEFFINGQPTRPVLFGRVTGARVLPMFSVCSPGATVTLVDRHPRSTSSVRRMLAA